MKVLGVISTTAMFLLLGATIPAFAQEEHHEESAKPAAKQEEAKPAKQEEAKPAKQEQAKLDRAAAAASRLTEAEHDKRIADEERDIAKRHQRRRARRGGPHLSGPVQLARHRADQEEL